MRWYLVYKDSESFYCGYVTHECYGYWRPLSYICVLAYLIETFHSYLDYTYRLNICTLAQLDDR